MCLSSLLSSRYVPTEWLEKKELTLSEVDNLNKLNLELSRCLTKISNVFAPFQHGNFSCVLVKDVSAAMALCNPPSLFPSLPPSLPSLPPSFPLSSLLICRCMNYLSG